MANRDSVKKYRASEKGKLARRNETKRRRKTPKHKEYMKKYLEEYQTREAVKAKRRKRQNTWGAKAAFILGGMKISSKRKGFPTPEFTKGEIILAIQDKLCCKTNIKFKLKEYGVDLHLRNPFVPSPDRIDNNKGYTKGNVQWVCWMYNQMKGQAKEEDVEYFVKQLIKSRKAQNNA